MLKKFYISWFVFVYALFAYFNKGVAYTYLAEATWVIGVVLAIRHYRSIEFPLDRRFILLLVILAVTLVYMLRGFITYPFMDVIRDSFMFNYAYFVFIIFLLKDDIEILKEKIYTVYKWFPLVVTVSFLLRTFIPSLLEVNVFGDVPFFLYKNGDLAVHVLITTFFTLNGNIKASLRFRVINIILIAYLFLVAATFNRGGMVSFVAGFSIYLFMLRKTPLGKQILGYLKYAPLVLIVALPLYINTKAQGVEQGRNVGLGQLKDNVVSLFNQDSQMGGEAGLNENVLWRLVWWGKIIDYTVFGDYFFYGKGLGINLTISDEVGDNDVPLRSPHNFSLNVLARFGVPFFIIWIWWLASMFYPLKTKTLSNDSLAYICILVASLINASFDVSLEGPMAAMPFWMFVGFIFLIDTSPRKTVNEEPPVGSQTSSMN
jgi:hypothetical protein